MTGIEPVTIALFAAAGIVLGLLHFGSLRFVAGRLIGGAGGRGALALYALRLAVTVAALVAAARIGAWPLLAMAGGLMVARALVFAVVRRTA